MRHIPRCPICSQRRVTSIPRSRFALRIDPCTPGAKRWGRQFHRQSPVALLNCIALSAPAIETSHRAYLGTVSSCDRHPLFVRSPNALPLVAVVWGEASQPTGNADLGLSIQRPRGPLAPLQLSALYFR